MILFKARHFLSHWTGEIFKGQFPEQTQKWAVTKQRAHIALFSQLTKKKVCDMSIKHTHNVSFYLMWSMLSDQLRKDDALDDKQAVHDREAFRSVSLSCLLYTVS